MNKLVITKTPLRVSIFGGGTDVKFFYKYEDGKVVSFAINKYIYVKIKIMNNFFKEKYRLNYSSVERKNRLNDISNEIIRECIKYSGIKEKLYISTISDIPDKSGLGSSSAFTVGLLNALFCLTNKRISKKQLAEISANIEINVLKKNIGKQDHYSAAFGGMNYFIFKKRDVITKKITNIKNINKILKHSLLLWTELSHDSYSILNDIKVKSKINFDSLIELKKLAEKNFKILKKGFKIEILMKDLEHAWELKKKLSNKITNKRINLITQDLEKSGIKSFKILGAGGGGFILIVSKINKLNVIRKKYKKQIIDIEISNQGSKVLYYE